MKKNKKSVVVLIFNTQNKLALQLRAAHDDSYPLHLDFSSAGGIEPNELHERAAHRELYEELGIGGVLTYIGEALYKDAAGTDQLFIYKMIHNGPFKPDKKEVEDIQFFSEDEIDVMISSPQKFHPEFIFLWKKIKKEFVETDFPKEVAAPARRALALIGVTRLHQVTEHTEEEIGSLHGMGPKALQAIRRVLSIRNLSFKQ